MDILGFITLVITAFTSCAEFGSYAFVHPVIHRQSTIFGSSRDCSKHSGGSCQG